MRLPEAAWAHQQELVNAAVDGGFRTGFTRSGRPVPPWISGSLLVCPGAVVGSWAGHRCWFVSVDDKWCFEDPAVMADYVIRQGEHGMRSLTVLPAGEGSLVELVSARSRGGSHELIEAIGWRVTHAELVPAGRRRSGHYEVPCARG